MAAKEVKTVDIDLSMLEMRDDSRKDAPGMNDYQGLRSLRQQRRESMGENRKILQDNYLSLKALKERSNSRGEMRSRSRGSEG